MTAKKSSRTPTAWRFSVWMWSNGNKEWVPWNVGTWDFKTLPDAIREITDHAALTAQSTAPEKSKWKIHDRRTGKTYRITAEAVIKTTILEDYLPFDRRNHKWRNTEEV